MWIESKNDVICDIFCIDKICTSLISYFCNNNNNNNNSNNNKRRNTYLIARKNVSPQGFDLMFNLAVIQHSFMLCKLKFTVSS
jgi:hypothetical protein